MIVKPGFALDDKTKAGSADTGRELASSLVLAEMRDVGRMGFSESIREVCAACRAPDQPFRTA